MVQICQCQLQVTIAEAAMPTSAWGQRLWLIVQILWDAMLMSLGQDNLLPCAAVELLSPKCIYMVQPQSGALVPHLAAMPQLTVPARWPRKHLHRF